MDEYLDLALRSNATSPHERHVKQWLASHGRRFHAATTNNGAELEIHVLDVIGSGFWYDGVTAKSVKAQLDSASNAKTIKVLVDSPGGSFFDGLAIQALLKRHGARVEAEVLGEASSAASVIVMGADKITMHQGSMMMIHEVRAGLMGTASEFLAMCDVLEKMNSSAIDIYTARTGRPRDDVTNLVMSETWMTAQEAVDLGFADEVSAARTKAPVPAATSNPKARSSLSQFSLDELESIASSEHPLAGVARQHIESRARARALRGLGSFTSNRAPALSGVLNQRKTTL